MFDGQHKQRPHQSFGKTGKMMSREETIKQAAEGRKQREHKCKQNDSAIIIQSWCRTHFERKKMREELRSEFDAELKTTESTISSPAAFLSLARKLACICKCREGELQNDDDSYGDDCRLLELSERMLATRGDLSEGMAMDRAETSGRYLVISVAKVLELCCRFIDRNAAKHDAHLRIPIQVLTEFLTPDVHSRSGAQDILDCFKEYLLNRGYFATMKILLDHEGADGTGLLELIRSFFFSQKENIRFLAYRRAAEEIFSRAPTGGATGLLLPALSTPDFPFAEMVDSLLDCREAGSFLSAPVRALGLLHYLLKMAQPHYESMDGERMSSFLEVVARAVRRGSPEGGWGGPKDEGPKNEGRGGGGGGSDDEEEEEEEEEEDDDRLLTDADGMDWINEYETSADRAEKRLRGICYHGLGNDEGLSRRVARLLRSFGEGRDGPLGTTDPRRAVGSLSVVAYNLVGSRKPSEAVRRYRLLSVLACSPSFVRRTWDLLTSPATPRPESYLVQITKQMDRSSEGLHLLSTFCNAYGYQLETFSDNDLRDESSLRLKPFESLGVLSRVALQLRDCCLALVSMLDPGTRTRMACGSAWAGGGAEDEPARGRGHDRECTRVFKETVALTRQLYERNCRINYLPSEEWVAPNWSLDLLGPNSRNLLDISPANNSGPGVRTYFTPQETSKLVVLKKLPFAINFFERVEFFRNLLNRDKPPSSFAIMNPSSSIKIRRDYIYEDAFESLQEKKVPDMKVKLHFSFISHLGLEEPGIDGGGIFRETIREVVKAGFNPDLGFFQVTKGMLHPNHLAERVSSDYLQHFYFLGRILGKAIYARLLVDLPLASFFLVKLLSQETTRLDIHHLASLDPEIHQGLLVVRDHPGDVREFDIYFACDYDELGTIKTVDLKPNGRSIQVNNQNKFEYIHLVADWYLNGRIRRHCTAFRNGLASVVDIDWLRMFDHNELQFIISGADLPIDLEDLKKNTNYTGGYTADHEVILYFWSVVGEMTETQRQDLLKFVTCSPRAPLYGFRELRPSFSIHHAGTETDRLPTSSTCMNLLKLPAFKDQATLKEKLLKAIEMGSGFELS